MIVYHVAMPRTTRAKGSEPPEPTGSPDPHADPATELMTIEQLAGASDLPFTTIRMYQHRGLLPPPERRGRVGYYGPAHRARLDLIASLQERGYSLAAIKDLVDTWQEGRSLTQVLGLEATAAGALARPVELRLQPEELAERFRGIDLDAAAMQRAYELDLIAFDDDAIVIRDPVFLDVGTTLARMGVPVAEILDEYEHLRSVSTELAARFTALFERDLWEPFVAAGMPAEEFGALTDALGQLGPMAEQIVLATLRRAVAEQAQRFLADRAKELG
jgi:DNA-binding transcriptional MerR regulator